MKSYLVNTTNRQLGSSKSLQKPLLTLVDAIEIRLQKVILVTVECYRINDVEALTLVFLGCNGKTYTLNIFAIGAIDWPTPPFENYDNLDIYMVDMIDVMSIQFYLINRFEFDHICRMQQNLNGVVLSKTVS